MNNNCQDLKSEIENIKKRNKKVETDKAWETCISRKILISLLTYSAITLFFFYTKLEKPFINAIVPTIGFVLSTLSMPIFKKYWIKFLYKNKRN